MKIQFVSRIPSKKSDVNLKVVLRARDTINICWFLSGITLFFIARKLSRCVLFHYGSAASVGMLMSWIIILLVLYRVLPFKKAMATLFVISTSVGFYFTDIVTNTIFELVHEYPYQIAGVSVFSGLLSMAIIYYFGPPSNEKSFNLIQWSLQIAAVCMIYLSSYCKEFSVSAIITVVLIKLISVYLVSGRSPTEAIERIADSSPFPSSLQPEGNDDVVFGKLVIKILRSLPEGVVKDELKIEIQNQMLHARMMLEHRVK